MRLSLVVLALALCATARAESPEEARTHFDKGTAEFALGRFEAAAAEYEKAYENKPDPALLYNAAQAHRLAGNKPRALLLYLNYLRVYGSKVDNRLEVQGHVKALERAIELDKTSAMSPPLAPRPTALPENTSPPEIPPPARVAPAALPPAHAEPAAATETPLIKRPLLWVVIGAVVVAAAVGIGLGVGLSGGPQDPVPSLGIVAGN